MTLWLFSAKFIIFSIVLCDPLCLFSVGNFLWLFIVLRFFLPFYILYFQDLSENHPGETVSWLKIIIIIVVIIITVLLLWSSSINKWHLTILGQGQTPHFSWAEPYATPLNHFPSSMFLHAVSQRFFAPLLSIQTKKPVYWLQMTNLWLFLISIRFGPCMWSSGCLRSRLGLMMILLF